MDDQKNARGLNLPAFDVELRRQGDTVQVYDPQRRKWVALTPEEWVRQHFVDMLVNRCGYPRHYIANEVGITFNGMRRRCDTVVYTRTLRPAAIIEYKQPDVPVNKAVVDQIYRYWSAMPCRHLIVSNGLHHFAFRLDGDNIEMLSAIPSYDEICKP